MKPIPPRMHHWAVAAFVIIVVGNVLIGLREPRVTEDQANMIAGAYKLRDLSLYPHDPVFAEVGAGAPWRARLPAWQALLSASLEVVGPEHPARALMLIGAGVVLLYLLTMYALLYRQTRSGSVAALVAILSTCVFSRNRPYWGIGPLFAVTPAVVYLAVVPLLVGAFLRLRGRPAVAGVFLLVGLCGNVHLASAVNLALVLALTDLALRRFRPAAVGLATVCLLAAAVGSGPAVVHYWRAAQAARAAGGWLPHMPFSQVREVLAASGTHVLYPEVLIQTVRWLPVACVLAAPAAVLLGRWGHRRVQYLPEWSWMLGAALFVALGLHGLVQIVAWMLKVPPPVTELFGALRLVMLPLYVLFAQASIHLLRLARTHRGWVRAALGVFTAVWLGSAYNTRPVRHMAQDLVTLAAGGEPRVRGAGADEIRAIARWAGGNNTPREAMFVTPDVRVRMYARRSVMCSPADGRYLYHMAPQRLVAWSDLLRRQRALLRPASGRPAGADGVLAFVDEYWRRSGCRPATTFLIFPVGTAPTAAGRLEEIPPPRVGTGAPAWGRQWRLFRVLPETPTTAPRSGISRMPRAAFGAAATCGLAAASAAQKNRFVTVRSIPGGVVGGKER